MKNYTLSTDEAHKLIRNRLRFSVSIILLTLTTTFIISTNAMQLPPAQNVEIGKYLADSSTQSGDTYRPAQPGNSVSNNPSADDQPPNNQPLMREDKQPQTYRYTIKAGDTLSEIIEHHGLSHELKYFLALDKKNLKEISTLRAGKTIAFSINDDSLEQLIYQPSPVERIIISRLDDKTLDFRKQTFTVEKSLVYASGTIKNSLYLAGKNANIPDKLIVEMATVLGWDIDFARDIRLNDYFVMLYEEEYIEGKKIRDGDIVALYFRNADEDYRIVQYTDSKGKEGYYFTDGKSVRKAFLRNPLDFAYISSHFNLKRHHPILHVIRAHKGVDYAAKRGTPVRTTSDGKIIFRGSKGGYGNTVIIRHGKSYKTLYAHLSKFAKKQRVGSFVKQGQVIGYVGSTGLSTGPHLHYELQVNGHHTNPVKAKLPNAKPLPATEMKRFREITQPLLAKLDIVNKAHLAAMGNDSSKQYR